LDNIVLLTEYCLIVSS